MTVTADDLGRRDELVHSGRRTMLTALAAAAVIGLVSDAMRKIASLPSGVGASMLSRPMYPIFHGGPGGCGTGPSKSCRL